ncbi:MAG: GIY-YIG nuclease family protein [Pirellulaceae bacterium]
MTNLFPISVTCILSAALCWSVSVACGQTPDETLRDTVDQVVIEAFAAKHDGYSSDEVILQSGLNAAFVAECQQSLPGITAAQCNWTLLNLRKAGKLTIRATRRNTRDSDPVAHIAEMCTRLVTDRHRVSIDRMMCDPIYRDEFDKAAEAIDGDIDLYLVRKSAFRLRKVRRLKPELITRIVDWGRVVTEHGAAELAESPERIPPNPGVYIFRDASGYLYIGEAANLRTRLRRHLDQSDSQSLASYLAENGFENITIELHAFAPDSRAREVTVRRAYESELIHSRQPRFNVRP